MTQRQNIINDLTELCRKHNIQIEANIEDAYTDVWNIPRDIDLDMNDKPKEYPIFRFILATKEGVTEHEL